MEEKLELTAVAGEIHLSFLPVFIWVLYWGLEKGLKTVETAQDDNLKVVNM